MLVRWSPRALAGGLEFALTRMNAGRNLNGDLRPSWAVGIFWEVTFGIKSSLRIFPMRATRFSMRFRDLEQVYGVVLH